MFKKVGCVLFRVPDLEKALKFYHGGLGHKLVWRRRNSAAGLAMSESDTEIVLMAQSETMEVDLLVGSVETDPWVNVLTMPDTSKGLLKVDSKGNVLD